MESASKKWIYRHPGAQVLPAVVVVIAMVALLALGTASDKAAAKGPSGGTLRGVTSQGQPAYLKTPNGRSINVAVIQLAYRCSDGESFVLPQEWRSLPITPRGTFTVAWSDSTVVEGVTVDFSEKFSGKFNRQRTAVVARMQSDAILHEPDGSVVTCASGNVTLRART